MFLNFSSNLRALVRLMFSCNDEDDSLRVIIVEPPLSSDCPLSMTETDFFTFDYASIKLEAAEDIREPSFQSLNLTYEIQLAIL